MKHIFSPRKNQYQMDITTANAALQNIFAACDKSPNTIPFDKIMLRQKVNTKPLHTLMIITACLFAFTLVSPFIVSPVSACIEKLMMGETVCLVTDYVQDDVLYLEFTGDNLLFEQAYAEASDGTRFYALSYDKELKQICFEYDSSTELNIYIPVRFSEPLHFLLSPYPEH